MNIKDNKNSTKIFFIICYTLISLIFSISISSISAQIKKLKADNPKFNKSISIQTDLEINMNLLQKHLSDQNVSVIVGFPTAKNVLVETYLVSNYQIPPEDLKSGRDFINEDFMSDKNIALISTSVDEKSIDIIKDNKLETINLDIIGTSYSKKMKMLLPNKLFEEALREKDLTKGDNIIRISGKPDDIEKSIAIINDKILNNAGTIETFDYFTQDISSEWRDLIQSAVFVLLIAFINSLGISTFIIEDARKSIGMKKICGASNFEILKEFFHEFKMTSVISFVLALSLHFLLSIIFSGYLFSLNIKLGLINIIATFIIINIVMIINLLPFFFKLKKIHPIDIIKEN